MKNIIKFCAGFCAVLGLLLLTGCPVPNMDTEQSGGLRISVDDNIGRSTLYPSAHFTKIKLSFENIGGSATYDDVEFEPHHYATITDLQNGEWKITATGYVKIGNDEYPAAEGNVTVTVTAGQFQSVSITINAKQNGDNGFLSYNIDFPSIVTEAQLYVFDIFDSYWNGTDHDIFSVKEGTITLAPGFYMMSVRLTTPYRTVAWTEVVHIYSNMETIAQRVFTEDDLTKLVTVSGTANITVNNMPPNYCNVELYESNDYESYPFYTTSVNDYDGEWNVYLPAFNASTTFYIIVKASFAGNIYIKELGTIELFTGHKEFGNTTHDFEDSFITVNGNAIVSLNGEILNYVYLTVKKWNNDWDGWEYFSDINVSIDSEEGTYLLYLSEDLLNEKIQLLMNEKVIEEFTIETSEVNLNMELHVADKVVISGTVDVKLGGVPYTDPLVVEVVGDWQFFWDDGIDPSGTWEAVIWADIYPMDVFIWVWTPETDWYYTGITFTLESQTYSSPTEQIEMDINLNINILPKVHSGIKDVFETNNNLGINVSNTEVSSGQTLFVEILDFFSGYTHRPVYECIWFINGVRQDVTTEISTEDNQYFSFSGQVNLPTTSLALGKQYALVVVTIDGTAFAHEFEFVVN